MWRTTRCNEELRPSNSNEEFEHLANSSIPSRLNRRIWKRKRQVAQSTIEDFVSKFKFGKTGIFLFWGCCYFALFQDSNSGLCSFHNIVVVAFHIQFNKVHKEPRRRMFLKPTSMDEAPSDSEDGCSSSAIIPALWSKQRNKRQQSIPPWLDRYYGEKIGSDSKSKRSGINSERDVRKEMIGFKYSLQEQGFTATSINEIVTMMLVQSCGKTGLLCGMIDFGRLLVSVMSFEDQHEHQQNSTTFGRSLVFEQMLKASMIHFCQCINSREKGLYDSIEDLPRLMPSSDSTGIKRNLLEEFSNESTITLADKSFEGDDHAAILIAKGAARIKRAEVLAHKILAFRQRKSSISQEEADMIRGLLLSTMDDWRSLFIRCVACLFRLNGILQITYDNFSSDAPTIENTKRHLEVIQTAREALLVFAPLAERLGMHRLKARIEERAFQILYPRQHEAVSVLFEQSGDAMQQIRSYLSLQVTQILLEDDALMSQLEDIGITSRVKEPFSFWKKIMKKRIKQAKKKQKNREGTAHVNNKGGITFNIEPETKHTSQSTPSLSAVSNLSVIEVQDGVAIRVILKARKLSPDETDEMTRLRERVLCYYVQHRLRKYWPALPFRMKDYIRDPKPNGYQSLHYTASISSRGKQFPFEVQVRSEEMHEIAEFGVAAHWDYKLASADSKKQLSSARAPELEENVTGKKHSGTIKDFIDHTSDVKLLALPYSENCTSYPAPEVVEDTLFNEKDFEFSPLTTSGDSYIDALVTARENLVQQNVFVFICGGPEVNSSYLPAENGQLITLPTGARIRDSLKALDGNCLSSKEMVSCCYQVWKNGKRAHLNEVIENGDVLLFEKII